jgi:hypothetical protein
MTTNIQKSTKTTKTNHENCKNSCSNSSLDTNTVLVGHLSPSLEKNLKKQSNRIDFLNDKNIGKQLITIQEIESKKNTRHTYCGYTSKSDYVNIVSNTTQNSENQSQQHHHFNGTASCKEIWRCPSCSLKLLKGRADEVYEIINQHKSQNYEIGFVTLTIKHSSKNTLKQSLDKLLNNYRKFQQHRHFKDLKKSTLLGQIKSLEITYSQKNGWHPHLHIIYFYNTKDKNQIKLDQTNLINKWAKYTDGSIDAQNQQIGYSSKKLSKYITKGENWDIVQELTNDFSKKSGSLKPFQFLTLIRKEKHQFTDDTLEVSLQKTKSLWLEYVEATKGKKRVIASRILNQLYKVKHKTDDEIVEEKQEGETIISFSKNVWKLIYHNNLQPYLLNICDNYPDHKVKQTEISQFLLEFEDISLTNSKTHPTIILTSEKDNFVLTTFENIKSLFIDSEE